jgi:hypothetical protein
MRHRIGRRLEQEGRGVFGVIGAAWRLKISATSSADFAYPVNVKQVAARIS